MTKFKEYLIGGRLSRLEFFFKSIIILISQIYVLFNNPFGQTGISGNSDFANIFGLVCFFGLAIFWYTIVIKRLHDFNQSGWWVIVAFIPFLSLFFLIFLIFKRGDDGENSFGYRKNSNDLNEIDKSLKGPWNK